MVGEGGGQREGESQERFNEVGERGGARGETRVGWLFFRIMEWLMVLWLMEVRDS